MTTPAELHESLLDTFNMLTKAYPDGINERDYFPILALLYEFFSDRSLANIISNITKKDPDLVLNDIYASVSTKKPSDTEMQSIKTYLNKYDFSSICTDDWIKNYKERGQILRDPHKSTPVPGPVDAPRFLTRAQASPRFFGTLNRVRYASIPALAAIAITLVDV